jgi:hypothetical protein
MASDERTQPFFISARGAYQKYKIYLSPLRKATISVSGRYIKADQMLLSWKCKRILSVRELSCPEIDLRKL